MSNTTFPDSRVTLDGITGGQVAVAAAALEKIADRLDEQQQAGAAELLRRLGVAICQQQIGRITDAAQAAFHGPVN